jgi:hypothetical protein
LGLGGIEGFFLELKDRKTPHVNFFQKARSKCENEMRKAGERKDVVCARVVCKKVVCDNVVCERVVCDKEERRGGEAEAAAEEEERPGAEQKNKKPTQ